MTPARRPSQLDVYAVLLTGFGLGLAVASLVFWLALPLRIPAPAAVPCKVVCDCEFDVTFPGASCTFINPRPDPEGGEQ